jgi:RNA-dependent RNA polymerase
VKSSRLLRRFADEHDIIIVRFEDEEVSHLQHEQCFDRILALCQEGFSINGAHYRFLFPSASQYRNQSTFFVAGDVEVVQNIRSEFGHAESDFSNIAKYLSSLALFATGDTPTANIPWSLAKEIPDTLTTDGMLLSDGAGVISVDLAMAIMRGMNSSEPTGASMLEEVQLPTALHARWGGLKGIFTVDHALVGQVLHYRSSMRKCNSTHETFCVVKVSKFVPLYLNRDVITLLLSLKGELWDPTEVIDDMHENELNEALEMFMNGDSAVNAIRQYMDTSHISHLIKSGFDLHADPFWNGLLQTIYQKRISRLRHKTHIFVEKGALLIGIPDEWNCLNHDEIFIRIQRPGETVCSIITGPVLLYRNPCLYPGMYGPEAVVTP